MEEGGKPKRAGLPKGKDIASFTLQDATSLLALPRIVGTHPETGKEIKAGLGRFGAYIQHDGKYISLKGDDDVLSIGMNRAVTLIAQAAEKGAGRKEATPLRSLGAHPEDGTPLNIYEGKYGAYIKYNKLNASLPKGADVESFTLQDAVALLASKEGGSTKTAKAARTPKSSAATSKKSSPKKAASKKPIAKKAASSKKDA
jgi:DNA topoisomerase-1